jgi:N-acetylmuramoyl-L-alanine amidase
MRWNSSAVASARARSFALACSAFAFAVAIAVIGAAAPPQTTDSTTRLSVYSAQSGASVPTSERDGRQYVSIGDLLQTLGEMRVEDNGRKWKARFNGQEMRFEEGKTRAKIRGKDLDLNAPFALDSGRGMVPIASLPQLLTPLLNNRVVLHETARRLFIGDAATQFTAEVNKASSAVVLNFSAPVNPAIHTEAGKVRMTFTREPLLSSAEKISLDDKTVAFSEADGAAQLDVTSNAPLLASFSNGGKTITLAPAPAPTPAPAAATVAPAAPPVPAAPAPQEVPAPAATFTGHGRNTIVLDAAHGGDERGAALSDKLAEKDVTLAFARRLRSELAGRGIPVMMVRDGDTTLTSDQRAQTANTWRAAIYVVIHAASLGSGVRVYTSVLPSVDFPPGPLAPWGRAQSSYLDSSHAVAESLAADLAEHKVPVALMAAPLRPLNNVTAPAVALELAPPAGEHTSAEALASSAYQQQMASSIAAALATARKKMEEAR